MSSRTRRWDEAADGRVVRDSRAEETEPVLEVEYSERDRLVREILDAVSARLSAIALTTAAELSNNQAALSSPDRNSLLIRVRSLSVEGMEELRAAVAALQEPIGGTVALPHDWSALPELIARRQGEGAQVSLHGQHPASLSFSKHVGTTGYLVIEEIIALADAGEVVIHLSEDGKAAVVSISMRPLSRIGGEEPISTGTRTRLHLVGGRLAFSSREGERTVTMTLPLRQP